MTRIAMYSVRVKLLADYASAKDFEHELERFNDANKGEIQVEFTKMAEGDI